MGMGKVNDSINAMYATIPSMPGLTSSKTNLGNGFIVGLDAGYSPIPGLSIGPRVEYLGGSGDIKASITGGSAEIDYNASMIPVLVGATYLAPISDAFSLGGGVYLGYGFGMASEKISSSGSFGSQNDTANYDGGSFAADINIDAKYKFSDVFNLGIKLGYRVANVAQMEATADVPDLGVKKGDIAKEQDNTTDMPFDFNGIVAGLDLGFSF